MALDTEAHNLGTFTSFFKPAAAHRPIKQRHKTKVNEYVVRLYLRRSGGSEGCCCSECVYVFLLLIGDRQHKCRRCIISALANYAPNCWPNEAAAGNANWGHAGMQPPSTLYRPRHITHSPHFYHNFFTPGGAMYVKITLIHYSILNLLLCFVLHT
jgi:hypothetical protein